MLIGFSRILDFTAFIVFTVICVYVLLYSVRIFVCYNFMVNKRFVNLH